MPLSAALTEVHRQTGNYETGSAVELQSHRGSVCNKLARLVDPDGKRHDYVGMDMIGQAPTEFGISYNFDVTGD